MSNDTVKKIELLELANKMNYAIKKYGIMEILKSIKGLDPDVHCDDKVNGTINNTCLQFNVSRADLFSEKRGIYNDARKSCYYLLYKYGSLSQKSISALFVRDEACVSRSIKEITALVASGAVYKHDKEIIQNILKIQDVI